MRELYNRASRSPAISGVWWYSFASRGRKGFQSGLSLYSGDRKKPVFEDFKRLSSGDYPSTASSAQPPKNRPPKDWLFICKYMQQ